ncbi:hypothetical protein LY76DRAFT_118522 [Colletotrichum caudatum]|nr:hypothetical protein LY76DRAFT_118522 [Colletotrichum caudatum]
MNDPQLSWPRHRRRGLESCHCIKPTRPSFTAAPLPVSTPIRSPADQLSNKYQGPHSLAGGPPDEYPSSNERQLARTQTFLRFFHFPFDLQQANPAPRVTVIQCPAYALGHGVSSDMSDTIRFAKVQRVSRPLNANDLPLLTTRISQSCSHRPTPAG